MLNILSREGPCHMTKNAPPQMPMVPPREREVPLVETQGRQLGGCLQPLTHMLQITEHKLLTRVHQGAATPVSQPWKTQETRTL